MDAIVTEEEAKGRSSDRLQRLVQHAARTHAEFLFPNTPIQIGAAENRLHFWVEGEWNSWTFGEVPQTALLWFQQANRRRMNQKEEWAWLLRNVKGELVQIIQVNFGSWSGYYPILHPEWVGWDQVNRSNLAEVLNGPHMDMSLKEVNSE